MPAHIPIDDATVQSELTRYLDDEWVAVIAKDVDGPHSLPLQLDRDNPTLGKFSATRRVARTIYLGSAPTQQAANRGIDDRRVKLGCVQPGETTATFGDALRHLSNRATYLYVDGKRFWYSTQPTVNRTAEDRAAQLKDDPAVTDEIIRRLRKQQSYRGDFEKIHACPSSSGDVPDEPDARLVILSPEYPHSSKSPKSPGFVVAASILESRGSSPRNYRNALAFLAADASRLKELEQAVQQYLAWTSIWNERKPLNLDNFQTTQAETKCKSADETVDGRIPETYQWLLLPGQPDPKGPVEWSDIRLQGPDELAVRASKKMKNDMLLLTQMGGNMLRLELDRIPLWRGDHVGLKLLAEDMAKYLYLPRLKNSDVLLGAVRDGIARLLWQAEAFGYAEKYDEKTKRYVGLQAGHAMQVLLDGQSVLVKGDVAAHQLEADRLERERQRAATTKDGTETTGDGSGGGGGTGVVDKTGGTGDGEKVIVQPPKLKRFHGTAELETLRLGSAAGKIAEHVVQHFSALTGVTVKVTLEIEADIPQGASDDLVRTITENCRTLKFRDQNFEES